ncbi:MAG: hypothetical protein ACPGUV_04935 [Polyangiales bacterium]
MIFLTACSASEAVRGKSQAKALSSEALNVVVDPGRFGADGKPVSEPACASTAGDAPPATVAELSGQYAAALRTKLEVGSEGDLPIKVVFASSGTAEVEQGAVLFVGLRFVGTKAASDPTAANNTPPTSDPNTANAPAPATPAATANDSPLQIRTRVLAPSTNAVDSRSNRLVAQLVEHVTESEGTQDAVDFASRAPFVVKSAGVDHALDMIQGQRIPGMVIEMLELGCEAEQGWRSASARDAMAGAIASTVRSHLAYFFGAADCTADDTDCDYAEPCALQGYVFDKATYDAEKANGRRTGWRPTSDSAVPTATIAATLGAPDDGTSVTVQSDANGRYCVPYFGASSDVWPAAALGQHIAQPDKTPISVQAEASINNDLYEGGETGCALFRGYEGAKLETNWCNISLTAVDTPTPDPAPTPTTPPQTTPPQTTPPHPQTTPPQTTPPQTTPTPRPTVPSPSGQGSDPSPSGPDPLLSDGLLTTSGSERGNPIGDVDPEPDAERAPEVGKGCASVAGLKGGPPLGLWLMLCSAFPLLRRRRWGGGVRHG